MAQRFCHGEGKLRCVRSAASLSQASLSSAELSATMRNMTRSNSVTPQKPKMQSCQGAAEDRRKRRFPARRMCWMY